ncbi:MAG: ABC transporter permease [Planctomycetota bacterium]|nr:ABC transporter permease [Planctomycetota bacterium]
MADAAASRANFFVRLLRALGGKFLGLLDHAGSLWYLLADTFAWLIRRLTQRRVRLGRPAIVAQIVRVGVQSIFIVALVSGSIGLILALQMAPPLDRLGQVELIPNIVGVAILRELGPLIAAIVLVGFAGASIAAEIGTMVVGEEVEALEAHALNPVRFLVLPRVLASVISMICLAVLSNLTALLAAATMSKIVLNISWVTYYNNTLSQVGTADFLTGLMKSAFFGLLIGLIACGNGLKVTGGAAGVGKATTSTVVESVVAVIFADLLFTVIFYSVGWA